MPMYQAVTWDRPDEGVFHPTFFMFFGFYKKTVIKGDVPWFPVRKRYLGWDIWDDMLPTNHMPYWPHNSRGSPYLEHLGVIKMKPPDFLKWISGCFQTGPLWIGVPTPGKQSRVNRHVNKVRRTARGGGKGRGRGGPQQSRGAN